MKTMKNSNVKYDKYQKVCRDLNEKILAPILDVPTRWNSTYFMLFRALQMRKVSLKLKLINATWTLFILTYCDHLIQSIDVLCGTDDDFFNYQIDAGGWQEIQYMLNFLGPFAEITTLMSGQSYPTISKVIPYFNVLMDHLDKYRFKFKHGKKFLPSCIRDAAAKAYIKVKQYYNKTNPTQCLVTLLDPRCNVHYFKVQKFAPEILDPIIER